MRARRPDKNGNYDIKGAPRARGESGALSALSERGKKGKDNKNERRRSYEPFERVHKMEIEMEFVNKIKLFVKDVFKLSRVNTWIFK